MKVNYDDFFDVFADGRVQKNTVTVYENGRIKISKDLYSQLEKKTLRFRMSFDYQRILLNQEGEVSIRKDGSFYAKNVVERMDRTKETFPLVYRMEWDAQHKHWIGTR